MKVLYIAGVNRSGTTLIDQVLGQVPPFFSTGELSDVWRRALRGVRCSCRAALLDCPFWSNVLMRIIDSEETTLEEAARLAEHYSHTRPRQLLAIARAHRSAVRARGSLERYVQIVARTYQAIAEESGAQVIVDSSKGPTPALVARLAGIEVEVLHVIRDPRAVIYSHCQATANASKPVPIKTAHVAWRWMLRNVAIEILLRGDRYRTLRYEDFVRDPTSAVRGVTNYVGEGKSPLPFDGPTTVRLGTHHVSGGNKSRFRDGQIDISLDNRWTRDSSRFGAAISTALSMPLLHHYGYRLAADV